MAQCRALRKDGQRCQARARKGSDYCVWHDPTKQGDGDLPDRILHITVVNHAVATTNRGDESYVDLRLPPASAGVALEILPAQLRASLKSPTLFAMAQKGFVGEVVRIRKESASLCIRIERAD
jgi:hypothetical protein